MPDIGLFEAIYSARSLRRLKPDPVPEALITQVLDAAIRAPTAGNAQNWAFVVVRDPTVRRALGADRVDVLGMLIRGGMVTIGIGLGLGLLMALSLTRLMSGLLFSVRPWDPLALCGAAAVLMAAALLAIFIPARRATTVNPMVALRYE